MVGFIDLEPPKSPAQRLLSAHLPRRENGKLFTTSPLATQELRFRVFETILRSHLPFNAMEELCNLITEYASRPKVPGDGKLATIYNTFNGF